MTPAQTALDIVRAIPVVLPCCDGNQSVPSVTLNALRDSVQDAADEEALVHFILRRCKPLVQAVLDGVRHITPQDEVDAVERLLRDIDARIGVDDD
jgi:ABC-type proline/glycine betaine transport system permease subunit